MSRIEFTQEIRNVLAAKIQRYFNEQLDQELGQFDAGFLLDFFIEEIGPFVYNQGLYDAQAVLQNNIDSLSEAISEIEKPIAYSS